jgi:transposase
MSKYHRNTKLAVVQRYLQGESSFALSQDTGIPSQQIRYWAQVYRIHTDQAFLKRLKPYSAEQKYHILLKMVTERWSIGHTSAFFNLASPGILATWHKRFLTDGLSGLSSRRGRPSMSKQTSNTQKTTPSSQEEKIKAMQEELDYLRAENAYLKKLDALLKEKERQTPKKQG